VIAQPGSASVSAAQTSASLGCSSLQRDEAATNKVAIISYDEKPGIQAISNTALDSLPKPRSHASFARDHEYQRHGTLSLLAGIDLLTGKAHACVEDRHRSREFVGFLKRLNDAYSGRHGNQRLGPSMEGPISRQAR
jgi:hypothetical protein